MRIESVGFLLLFFLDNHHDTIAFRASVCIIFIASLMKGIQVCIDGVSGVN